MNRKYWRRSVTALMVVAAVSLVGCASGGSCIDCQPGSLQWHWAKAEAKPAPAPKAAPAPAPKAPAPAPAPMAATASMMFPSAVLAGAGQDGCCAKVSLGKTAPRSVSVGQVYEYKLTATNRGNVQVRDVIITDVLPANFKMAESNPPVSGTSGDKTSWDLGTLDPGASKSVTIKGAATGVGQLVNCATVSFVPYICVVTDVVQPALALTKVAPAEVMVCDVIPVKITVTNTGTGNADNVVVTDTLPAGLTTDDGKNSITVNVGTLAAGQSREITANLKAAKSGTYNNVAKANADGNLTAEASTTTVVREPKLTITKTGNEKILLGRDVVYKIVVSNTGDGDARDTVVQDQLPAGSTVRSISDGGTQSGNTVVWNLGTLKPGQSKNLEVRLAVDAKGTVVNKAIARAVCAGAVEATTETAVEGIPAILLEVIDINDPVEIGQEEIYEIVTTNQGSAIGRNITIVAELEDAQEFVSADGSVTPVASVSANKREIVFRPLPELAPAAQAKWIVRVKALKAGDIRFTIKMTEERLERPVMETEATYQYK